MPRVTKGGISHGERNRDRQRQKRCKPRQPTLFFLYLCCVSLGTRKTDGHVVAKVKGPIVPPAQYNRFDRQLRPMGKLARDQLAHEGRIDLYTRRRRLSRDDFFQVVRPLHLPNTIAARAETGKRLRRFGPKAASKHGGLPGESREATARRVSFCVCVRNGSMCVGTSNRGFSYER
jgi:hypothetical protein